MIRFTRQKLAKTKNRRLKKYEVLEIVELCKSGVSRHFIADFYQCSQSLVHFISCGYRWSKLTKISPHFSSLRKAHSNRKLSVQKVQSLRKNWGKGKSQGQLANMYKLSQPTIFDIVHKRTYRNVGN